MVLSFSAGEGSAPCTSSVLQEKQSESPPPPPTSIFPFLGWVQAPRAWGLSRPLTAQGVVGPSSPCLWAGSEAWDHSLPHELSPRF